MIVGGFTAFCSSLALASAPVPYTFGSSSICRWPSCSCTSSSPSRAGGSDGVERGLVLAGYAVAVVAQLLALLPRRLRPRQPARLVRPGGRARRAARRARPPERDAARRRRDPRPRRRRSALPLRRRLAWLIDCFAGGLVMLALLFLCGALGLIQGQFVFEATRRVTLFVLGLAPLAFLAGILQARLARSAVGDLLVELRSQPSARELARRAGPRSARSIADPPLLAVRRQLGGRGRPAGHPSRGRRPHDHPDRPRRDPRRRARARPMARTTSASCSTRWRPPRGSRSRTRGCRSSCAPVSTSSSASRRRILEAGQSERQRMERNLHDGAQQRLVALSLELGLLEARFAGDPAGAGADRSGQARAGRLARGAARAGPRPASGGALAATGSPRRSRAWSRAHRCPWASRCSSRRGCPSSTRSRPTTSSRRA